MWLQRDSERLSKAAKILIYGVFAFVEVRFQDDQLYETMNTVTVTGSLYDFNPPRDLCNK